MRLLSAHYGDNSVQAVGGSGGSGSGKDVGASKATSPGGPAGVTVKAEPMDVDDGAGAAAGEEEEEGASAIRVLVDGTGALVEYPSLKVTCPDDKITHRIVRILQSHKQIWGEVPLA
eukprot:CAMPEP_0177674554 /NCGR_PEP_ID=MMETSP0447-20121125/26628_1 /TAXON_ID=0 /ORGANISM="Stygamoeba regulata, Strain BSH-02190019" /LENGTH=116 /DNA_ID=CAMNT_0019182679 /DNA_START=24 /DNA_END=374 /DNA_ORIENTATION=-